MFFSLAGPNTEIELAREDPGEVVEEARRFPAGRGKQAASHFYPAQTPGLSSSKSCRGLSSPFGLARPRSLRPDKGLRKPHRGRRESPIPGGQAAWVSLHLKKGSLPGQLLRGSSTPRPSPKL